ncbi:MAG: hypothetical protein ACOVKV_03895 [Novosphingobium sp.]
MSAAGRWLAHLFTGPFERVVERIDRGLINLMGILPSLRLLLL